MDLDLNRKKIGIIGGNDPCCEILDLLSHPELSELDCKVLMVADPLVQNQGAACAKKLNIPTATSYDALLDIEDLELVLKLKTDESLVPILAALESRNVKVLDLGPYRAVAFIGMLKTEAEKARVKAQILDKDVCRDDLVSLLETYSESIADVYKKKTAFLKNERSELLELEKELTQVIQGSMIPTFIINNEHILTHWNQACEKLTGQKAYELVGTDRQWVPFRSAKRPTLADMVVDGLDEAQITRYFGTSWRRSQIVQEALEAEEFFPHLGEDGKWIFFTAAPIKSPDGKVIGAIETLRDRSEDKAAQKEIALQDKELVKLHEKYKKSEEKYRSLFNNNPNPIFIVDSKTLEVIDMNHRVEVDYGYSKSDLLGTSFLDICDKDDDTLESALQGLGPGDTCLFTKKKHKKKSGEYFFTNTTVVNTTYANRDALIAASTDITESVEKETQLIQAGKLATLGTMAAGMAHEINQPLNVIQICADLMMKMMKKGMRIPDDELKLIANDIIENVARAAGVIKHVRDFSRQSERSLKKLDVNDPVSDVFKVLGHQISSHAIRVELNLADDLPQIRAEHNRLEQVFINLVTNAIDAMDEKAAKAQGHVDKVLGIKTWSESDQVCVSVVDTGIGMSEAVRNKIFEPFFTTKDTGKGTGLGTSISFGIIKDYSGTIEINSEEGQGAEFVIRFPAIS
ncbi:MAG: PAS domain-containing sensor histidine kinase [Desulfobacterales bacterium]|nr:MAG: PAS domain-containing sensor histidine kinase [Desulfobacterales bacterium]